MQNTLLLILVLFLLPLGTHIAWWAARDDLAASWSRADWTSAGILPPAAAHEAATVRIYAARTGRWKGAFAHHSWIVVKPEGALRYTVLKFRSSTRACARSMAPVTILASIGWLSSMPRRSIMATTRSLANRRISSSSNDT